MRNIDERVLAEQIKKENEKIIIVDNYSPNLKTAAVTAKFYSKYDRVNMKDVKQEWIDKIVYAKTLLPKDKFRYPPTANQSYGWNAQPLIKMNRNDKRHYHPIVENPATKIETKLKCDRSLTLPKFSGIPFKLL